MSDHKKLFDLNCAEAQESLSAMLDGEMDLSEEAAIRRHIQQCTTCQKFERDMTVLQSRIAAIPERPGDGAAAWMRASAELASQGNRIDNAASRPAWRDAKRWAVAATVALGLLIGSWQIHAPKPSDGAIIAETVRDFRVFQASGEVLDINATHPDAVHNWMTARVDFTLPAGLHAPEGIRIAGARLCSLLGRKLAFIAYTVDGNDVGFYIAKADGLDLPADGSMTTLRNEDDLTTIGWRTGDLAYVLVSPMPAKELSRVGSYFLKASQVSEL